MRGFLLGCTLSAVLLFATHPSTGRADEKDAAAAGTATYAEIEIKGAYPEGAQLPGLFGEMTESLDVAIARLDKAAGDEKIAGVILKIHDPRHRLEPR